MKATTLLALLVLGCASQVELADRIDSGDEAPDASDTSISATVSQCADGQCHRLELDDTCRCPGATQPAEWICEQCKDGACSMAIPNTTCPGGCTDCFVTCHSIYLSTLSMPYDFRFSYTCK